MITESKFLTELDGRWIDDDTFMLLADLKYQSVVLGGVLTIPAGFVTDFASVPRVPFIYEAFGDKAHHESVPHDYLYQKHEVTIEKENAQKCGLFVNRPLADQVFKEALKARKKPLSVVFGMYWGVRIGGWNSYRTGPERFRILNPDLDKNNYCSCSSGKSSLSNPTS